MKKSSLWIVYAALLMVLMVGVTFAENGETALAPADEVQIAIDILQAETAMSVNPPVEINGAFGCISLYSCSESCYAQRQNCISNCGSGDFECVDQCMLCYRACVFGDCV